jgi:hypothetical protein
MRSSLARQGKKTDGGVGGLSSPESLSDLLFYYPYCGVLRAASAAVLSAPVVVSVAAQGAVEVDATSTSISILHRPHHTRERRRLKRGISSTSLRLNLPIKLLRTKQPLPRRSPRSMPPPTSRYTKIRCLRCRAGIMLRAGRWRS